jgi:hypothetical protein
LCAEIQDDFAGKKADIDGETGSAGRPGQEFVAFGV